MERSIIVISIPPPIFQLNNNLLTNSFYQVLSWLLLWWCLEQWLTILHWDDCVPDSCYSLMFNPIYNSDPPPSQSSLSSVRPTRHSLLNKALSSAGLSLLTPAISFLSSASQLCTRLAAELYKMAACLLQLIIWKMHLVATKNRRKSLKITEEKKNKKRSAAICDISSVSRVSSCLACSGPDPVPSPNNITSEN